MMIKMMIIKKRMIMTRKQQVPNHGKKYTKKSGKHNDKSYLKTTFIFSLPSHFYER